MSSLYDAFLWIGAMYNFSNADIFLILLAHCVLSAQLELGEKAAVSPMGEADENNKQMKTLIA